MLTSLSYSQQKKEYAKTGYLHTYYPWKLYLFFAPVYEELLFRYLILVVVLHFSDFRIASGASSFLFGLWHVKNIKYQSLEVTAYQCLYTGLFLGPLFAYVTILSGSIYAAIFLHTLNNYLSPISQALVKKIRLKIELD